MASPSVNMYLGLFGPAIWLFPRRKFIPTKHLRHSGPFPVQWTWMTFSLNMGMWSALVNIVERPSCLRSDFGNVWRHARLVVPRVTHLSFASIVHSDLSDDLMFVSRSCLACLFIPRLIKARRCHCICLERMFKFFASIERASWRIKKVLSAYVTE